MNLISVVIITHNEERNIKRCLDSLVDVADEIVVIDSFSTDRTKEICNHYNVNFIETQWKGYAGSKNFGNNKTSYDYILSLDADEEFSEELKQSILKEKAKGLSGTYSFNRLTNYCGSLIRHSGWYPDEKIRIFPKEFTKWTGEFVHEELSFSKPLKNKHLNGDLLHYSYTNSKEHRERADKYSVLTAQKMHNANKKASILKPYLSAIARFISMYIFKLGFLDGIAGFKIAYISAQSNVVKYKTLIALNKSTNK